MHYDTFPVIKADPHEFQSKVGSLAEVIILGDRTKLRDLMF